MKGPLRTPDATLGIVGGGQLGRMIAEAAGPLGVDVIVLDPTPEAPASAVARDQITGRYDDLDALRELTNRATQLTYEIELADPDVLESILSARDVEVDPKPSTLSTIKDKLVQNRALADAGIPVPEFRPVSTPQDLKEALDELGYPAMLKAREGGYDGRGNVPIHSSDDAADAYRAIEGPAMLEEFVDYDRELSVIAVQGADERRFLPVGENVHEEQILRETIVPARTTDDVREQARAVADDVLDVLEGRGVFAIELFEVSEARRASDSRAADGRDADGEVLVNEIAPRPHNSGHWSIEGAYSSQFDQLVRALMGRPLGSTELRSPTVMTNVLGDVDTEQTAALSGVDSVFAADDANLHWYGKREVRPLRKMGHVTVTGESDEDVDDVLERAREYRDRLTFAVD
jgi:5-(carboxyamino)imidazole ribonucleotide synthase